MSLNQQVKVGSHYLLIETTPEVIKSDYYSDFLLERLIKIFPAFSRHGVEVLEIGTGRGFIAMALANFFPQIRKIVATDISSAAVQLAKRNILVNGLGGKIEVRGPADLFDQIKRNEKFDVIISVPPQIPITKTRLRLLGDKVEAHHETSSVGGADGLRVVRRLVVGAPSFLRPRGFLALVQADFSSPEETASMMKSMGLAPRIFGRQRKLLRETRLTKLIKDSIVQKGYRFRRDSAGREYFNLVVLLGYKNG